MESLTQDERNRLDKLLVHLDTFPTPELITTAHKLRMKSELTETISEQSKLQLRTSFAGAWAFGKIGSYLTVLRHVNSLRLDTGKTIAAHYERLENVDSSDIVSQVNLLQEIDELSGIQEVYFHQYAAAVDTIGDLLVLVTRAVSIKIPQDTRDLLGSYKPLRNYFEHLDRGRPGGPYDVHVVTETHTEYEWNITHGLRSDNQGRIVLGTAVVDVTSRGVDAIDRAMSVLRPKIREGCLKLAYEHYLLNPGEIPDTRDVVFKSHTRTSKSGNPHD